MDSGCFHLSATVKNGTTKMGVQIFVFLLSVILGINPEVGLVDHVVTLCLVF